MNILEINKNQDNCHFLLLTFNHKHTHTLHDNWEFELQNIPTFLIVPLSSSFSFYQFHPIPLSSKIVITQNGDRDFQKTLSATFSGATGFY